MTWFKIHKVRKMAELPRQINKTLNHKRILNMLLWSKYKINFRLGRITYETGLIWYIDRCKDTKI